MTNKIFFAFLSAMLIASVSTQYGGWGANVNPLNPPYAAAIPWIPQWEPCTTIGTACADCTTKDICTKIGGIKRACTDPTLPYCNAGICSATPTPECAPVS